MVEPPSPRLQRAEDFTVGALGRRVYYSCVSASELIEQFKALPEEERAQVAKFVVENDDSWIPESFKQGMSDAEAGRFVDLDIALNEPYPDDK